MARGTWIGLGLVVLAGCDGGGASVAPSPAPVTTPNLAAANAGGVGETAEPARSEAAATGAAAGAGDDRGGLVGWWRGPQTCVELFANGDFELVDNAEPKVMVMGKASVTAGDGGAVNLGLATERIWKGRFTGPCRKVHELGDFKQEHEVLGVRFKPGEAGALTLKRTGEATVELCGARCEALTRDTPALGARWRRARMDYPDRPEQGWAAGELLELDLNTTLGHVWVGRANGKFGTMYARLTVKYVGPDTFTVTLAPERYHVDADILQETPSALGVAFAVGGTQELQVRRLAGERIEVCGAASQCATLERQFDAYDHGI